MRAVSCLWLLLLSCRCSDNVEVGYNEQSAGMATQSGGAGGTGFTGGTGGGGSPGTACEPSECLGKSYSCGDCMDNDGDGSVDARDPDCLGPCDNSEDSYFGNIPGQNNGGSCRQDCYFDRNSGLGNDRCAWSQTCDSLSVSPGFPPSGQAACAYDPAASVTGRNCADMAATQPAGCLEACLPLTPNGCDCFGCCELPAKSKNFVWIGSESAGSGTCDAQHVDDPAACRPCTPVASCFNACNACEICVGTTTRDPSCMVGGEPTCESGAAPCGTDFRCAPGEYCITGCCIPAPR